MWKENARPETSHKPCTYYITYLFRLLLGETSSCIQTSNRFLDWWKWQNRWEKCSWVIFFKWGLVIKTMITFPADSHRDACRHSASALPWVQREELMKQTTKRRPSRTSSSDSCGTNTKQSPPTNFLSSSKPHMVCFTQSWLMSKCWMWPCIILHSWRSCWQKHVNYMESVWILQK